VLRGPTRRRVFLKLLFSFFFLLNVSEQAAVKLSAAQTLHTGSQHYDNFLFLQLLRLLAPPSPTQSAVTVCAALYLRQVAVQLMFGRLQEPLEQADDRGEDELILILQRRHERCHMF